MMAAAESSVVVGVKAAHTFEETDKLVGEAPHWFPRPWGGGG